jgi:hypothetical protein
MHVQTPWVNKLLFPPAIKNKRMELLMADRLAALIKHVAKLCQAGLEACLCVKEFYLRWIRPLDHRRHWHSNVHGWLIPAVTLQKVISSSFLDIVDNNPVLI